MKSTVRTVDKPWGREIIWAETTFYVGKILEIDAGQKLSLQFHEVKTETIRLLTGKMKLILAGNEYILLPGDVYHISPGAVHRMCAIEDCQVLEVSTTELEDVVRIADDYGR
jgi:mannose-6-phosphate isomerase